MSLYKHIKTIVSESCFPINVMVWQNIRFRISRYWITLYEIFQGCIVFLALFLARQSISPANPYALINFQRDNNSVNKILFSPRNNFTESLMNDAVNDLNNNPANGMRSKPRWALSREFVLFDDTQPSNVDNNVVIVHFMSPDTNTSNFTYYIKMLNRTPPRKEDKKYNNEDVATPFLGRIQWAIDKSFIKQLANQNVTHLELDTKVEYITKDLANLHKFIILCSIMAPLPFFMDKSSAIIITKGSGFRGLVRLAGVTSNAFRLAHLFDATVMGTLCAVIIAFLLKVTSKPILQHTNSLIIVITIILYFLNVTVLALFVTTLSWKHHHAHSVAFLVYICSFMLDSSWHSLGTTTINLRKIICCLMPHAPIYMFWTEVTFSEFLGQGVTFSNITKRRYSLSVVETWLFSCIQFTVMYTVNWYMDSVNPGKFVIPRPWNFIFQREFLRRKRKKRVNFHVTAEYNTQVLRDQRYFEPGPLNAEIAVKISKVCKKFPNETRNALDDISLDVYRGQVTVLLGQSGSGKSALISIIAGLYVPTSGTVYVNGLDNVQRVRDLSDIVAICPQELIINKRLTVRENVMLFSMLTRKHTGKTADELMMQLNLADKANCYHTELSKGMLRCLQVVCALVGNADVLVLDEPSSSMDYEARHRLWDLIMDLRGEKTIIMTTSYLEEAEALGDRIAILSKGKLRCHGSPRFLKEAVGGGFNLTITLKQNENMEKLHGLVEKTIPNITYKLYDKNTVSFLLPVKEHNLFAELFDSIEEQSKDLTITAIDVGLIMEDIFLQFIDEADDDDIHFQIGQRELDSEQLKGSALILQQFKVLIKRNYDYVLMKKYQFIIVQVLIPIIGIIITTLTSNKYLGFAKFYQIEEVEPIKLLYNLGPYRRSNLHGIIDFNDLEAIYSNDVEKEFEDPQNLNDVPHRAIGLVMSPNKSKLIVPSNPFDVSKSVNIFSNMYLHIFVPNNKRRIVTTFKAEPRQSNVVVKPKTWFLCIKWCLCVAFLSILNLTPSIFLSILERKSGSRDTHIMAGCLPIVHWGAKLVTHFLLFMAVIPFTVVFCTFVLDYDKTFDNLLFAGTVFFVLILFALAFLAHLYCLSHIVVESVAITQIFTMSLGIGIVIPILLHVMERLWDLYPWLILPSKIITVFAHLSPLYPFCVGLMHIATQSRLNAYCNLNKAQCPDLVVGLDLFSTEVCCGSTSRAPFKYLNKTGSMYLVLLLLHFFVYSILVLLLEKRVIQSIFELITHFNYQKPKQIRCSAEVNQEIDEVRNLVDNKQFYKDVFVASDIHKSFKYFNAFKYKSSLNAVTGVSFKAKAGECIAIVGPLGAGKSALIKMLSGAFVMTRGNCWTEGYSLKTQRSKYVQRVGYAGLDKFLTGNQNLLLIGQLQGFSYNKAMVAGASILRYLGLNLCRDVQVTKYNLSSVRRLELAMVYTLAPVVAFLDEPMLNADLVTKPLITRALDLLIADSTTVIMGVTSVTRRDMELLYDRIAILSEGQFAAIGPAAEVIKRFTFGYMVRIKINVVTSYKIDVEDDIPLLSDLKRTQFTQSCIAFGLGVEDIKKDFKEMFKNSVLTEEHVCLLIFYIEDSDNTMLYSEMFSKLHELQLKYQTIIDHYKLSAANIEDVFWRIKRDTMQN